MLLRPGCDAAVAFLATAADTCRINSELKEQQVPCTYDWFYTKPVKVRWPLRLLLLPSPLWWVRGRSFCWWECFWVKFTWVPRQCWPAHAVCDWGTPQTLFWWPRHANLHPESSPTARVPVMPTSQIQWPFRGKGCFFFLTYQAWCFNHFLCRTAALGSFNCIKSGWF